MAALRAELRRRLGDRDLTDDPAEVARIETIICGLKAWLAERPGGSR